jgi:hypothetical protein
MTGQLYRDAWNNASGAIIGTAYLQILANAIDEKRPSAS